MGAPLFDTHCHIYMDEFRGDVQAVLARASEAGVARALVIGCDELSSREAISFVKAHSTPELELRATVGVHPHEASSVSAGLPEELTDLAANSSVCAVGEIGLDYFYDNSPRDVQLRAFEQQLDWAAEADRPVVLHLRSAADPRSGDAYRDAMRVLKGHLPPRRGVVHCFSGGVAEARAALDLGFFISFSGPVTYPKAVELREAASFVPIDRLLCETDSPYLAPQSRRGKRNEPALVRDVYARIAELRGMTIDALAEIVMHNAELAFGL